MTGQGYGVANARSEELRTVEAYPSRWGPGKVHAARYFRHRMWERGWFPICLLDHMHAGKAVKVARRDLASVVTCGRCLRILAAQGISGRAVTEGSGRRSLSVVAGDEIPYVPTDLGE